MEINNEDFIYNLKNNASLLKNKETNKKYKKIVTERIEHLKSTLFKNVIFGHISEEEMNEINIKYLDKNYIETNITSPIDYF